jgi:hypothetical protein
VFPLLSVLAVWGSHEFFRINRKMLRFASAGLVGLLLLAGLLNIIRLHPNQVVYFNWLVVGGIEKAATRYETDYWRNSYKQGLSWVDQQEPVRVGKIAIAAGNGNIRWMIDRDRYEMPRLPDEAEYYLGTTRFDECKVIPGRIAHTVKVDGAPIMYVIQPDSSYNDDPFFDSPFR